MQAMTPDVDMETAVSYADEGAAHPDYVQSCDVSLQRGGGGSVLLSSSSPTDIIAGDKSLKHQYAWEGELSDAARLPTLYTTEKIGMRKGVYLDPPHASSSTSPLSLFEVPPTSSMLRSSIIPITMQTQHKATTVEMMDQEKTQTVESPQSQQFDTDKLQEILKTALANSGRT